MVHSAGENEKQESSILMQDDDSVMDNNDAVDIISHYALNLIYV